MRPLTPDDALHFYDLNLDPEVIRYTGDVAFDSVEKSRQFLQKYDQYEKFGTGRFAVISKDDNSFLGWCGLKYSPEIQEYDIGFRFFKKYWNQGYATETAAACLDFGFNSFDMNEIVGRAIKINVASVKVLEKLGLTFMKSADFHGMEGVIYSITRKKYKNFKS